MKFTFSIVVIMALNINFKGRIPVKWTAYESLMYNQYTSQSDV